MNNKPSYPSLIQKLLQSKSAMTLKQIRHEIPDRPRSSLFRDLTKIKLFTSYTHAGQYHALQSVINFNPDGLWFYEKIAFSKYGTLKNTLIEMVSNSPAGMTHKELKLLLRIQVQNPLTLLIKSELLQRRSLPEKIFVYLSNSGSIAEAQWEMRSDLSEKALGMILPSDTMVIEILLEVIRGSGHAVDEEVLNLGLKQRGVNIQKEQLIYVLTYYDIKKNRS